jgi:glycosidase
MGLRVVLDGVFNHSAPEFFAFRDLEENWEETPYRNWYYCDGRPKRPESRLVKPNYKCFSYFGGMPKLNLENEETAQYFIDVALYWLRTAKIDGWRLDVGDEISHYFWRRFRHAVKAEFPEALIVGEVWHYAADFLQGDNWDSVMNYPFLNAVMDFVADETISATDFLNELGFLRGNLNNACQSVLWNLLDSHDTPRALHRCGENKDKLKLMAAIQLLLPGMPFLYYGDEVGMTGGRDPDCRRGMLWEESRQNQALLAYYRRLIQIRKDWLCLTEGDPDEQTADDEAGLVTIRRGNLLLAFHGRDGEVKMNIPNAYDLITDTAFDGTLGPYQAAVLKI